MRVPCWARAPVSHPSRAQSSVAAPTARECMTIGNIIKGTIGMKVKLLNHVLAANFVLCLTCAGNSEPDYQLALRYTRQADWKSADTVLDRLLLKSPEYM